MRALYVGCDRLLWASLGHTDGHTSDWVLSDHGTCMADSVQMLLPPILQALTRHVQDVLATPPGPARDNALSSYAHMNARTRSQIEAHLDAGDDKRPEEITIGIGQAGMSARDAVLVEAIRIAPSTSPGVGCSTAPGNRTARHWR